MLAVTTSTVIKKIYLIFAWLIVCLLSINLVAQDTLNYNQVDFSIHTQKSLTPDRLRVSFYSEITLKNITQIKQGINKAMQQALLVLKKYPSVKAQTKQYRINPVYEKGRKTNKWTGKQTLEVVIDDLSQAANIIQDLQAVLIIANSNFFLSPALYDNTKKQLLEQALSKFKQQSIALVMQLEAKDYKMVRLNIGGNGHTPIAFNKQYASHSSIQLNKSRVPPPALSAGQTQVKVNINATIELLY